MPVTSPSSRVGRRAVACARCRTRKIMCDARFPSCSRCLEVGVSCVASGTSKERTAPRSIVLFLEAELARLEKNAAGDDGINGSRSSPLLDQIINDITPPFLGLTAAVPLVQCAVAGTRLPSTTLLDIADTTTNEHGPRSILNPPISPAGALSSVPEKVADFLFENYRTRVVAQYPIFYSADIVRYYNSVFHNQISGLEPGALATPYEVYVVSLVMAISLTTAARTQQAWANSIAAGLLKTAMQHIRSVCTNDIAGLQALLLLLEYGFLDPSAANVWFLSGFTTQACIDLGLHHESLDSRGMDHLTIDVRRRVFWCTYEMEIATSGALLRPSSLLSKQVSVPFPAEVDDDAISASGVDSNGRATKFASRRIWQYRQVEAEVVSVLFHHGEIPHNSNSLDAWIDEIEAKVNSWHDEIYWSATLNTDTEKVSQWEEMCLYADIAREYIIVTLFRPSPRIKEPKGEHLMKAFQAGVGIADGYWKQSNLGFGNSKYVFHCCYHTFSGAIVFLQALQRCKESISATYSLDEVEKFPYTVLPVLHDYCRKVAVCISVPGGV